MTDLKPESDSRSVDHVLCLIACFFLSLFVLILAFYIVCPDQKYPVLIDSGLNP